MMSRAEEKMTSGEPKKGIGTTVERLRDQDPVGESEKTIRPHDETKQTIVGYDVMGSRRDGRDHALERVDFHIDHPNVL